MAIARKGPIHLKWIPSQTFSEPAKLENSTIEKFSEICKTSQRRFNVFGNTLDRLVKNT